jgi:hypothetical protein
MFKINKHIFNNYIFSIILFEFRYEFLFLIIIEFSIKSSRDPASDLRDPDLGRDQRLGTTALEY